MFAVVTTISNDDLLKLTLFPTHEVIKIEQFRRNNDIPCNNQLIFIVITDIIYSYRTERW